MLLYIYIETALVLAPELMRPLANANCHYCRIAWGPAIFFTRFIYNASQFPIYMLMKGSSETIQKRPKALCMCCCERRGPTASWDGAFELSRHQPRQTWDKPRPELAQSPCVAFACRTRATRRRRRWHRGHRHMRSAGSPVEKIRRGSR